MVAGREVVGTAVVGAESDEDRKGWRSMTVVAVAVGSWVERSWKVGGGPDVLDWMKSCVRARNEAMLAGECWRGVLG